MILKEHYQENDINWYKKDNIKLIVEEYLAAIATIGINNKLTQSVCRCCKVLFLTSNSNRARNNILCPFGCRENHRKRESNKRAREYYSTPEGKIKKKQQNEKRNNKNRSKNSKNSCSGKDISKYLFLILTTIEMHRIREAEIEKILHTIKNELRQHSLEKFIEKVKMEILVRLNEKKINGGLCFQSNLVT